MTFHDFLKKNEQVSKIVFTLQTYKIELNS